jgi:2-polyprenyl-6-hydroxyphenyl methylase/3-demethylubiquinone-9 3-methyltransferase
MAEDRFAFGANWRDYSNAALDDNAYQAALAHITAAVDHVATRRSFVDVGCGSGLFLRAAAEVGFEKLVGFDLDPLSVETTTRVLADAGLDSAADVRRGDVLDRQLITELGTHSMVYAWGSLHHTGKMWEAIENAASLVEPGGVLMIAIYNRTWSSGAWRRIKRAYVRSGPFVQRLMVSSTWIVGATARAIYTRSSPFRQRRGMSFYHNIVDWVGGYPYECASVDEIRSFVEPLGFETLSAERGPTPIACNEFIFRRHAQ